MKNFSFQINHTLGTARSGKITTPHGSIETPAFIPVGTQATLKALTPEQLKDEGAQAVLANAYHLYLRPGPGIIEDGGGLAKFMNWKGPTFTDSGGFQVMSLGSGFKKVIDMSENSHQNVPKKDRMAWIDDGGVTFKSHIDGSRHRFNPEISMQIQHKLGADIIFAFDELTTLVDDKEYQINSLNNRTHPWAVRSLAEHKRLTSLYPERPYQALFGVVQGAQHEDLRRYSSKFMASLDFDGYGLGGALTKAGLGEITKWMAEELPDEKPRHMLGISEPEDIFICIENGADTFDCVSPARIGRNGTLYLTTGKVNITNARFKNDFNPIDDTCACYTCKNYSRAYLHHLFRSKELLSNTLATIHNEHFIIKLVDDIRASIESGELGAFKKDWLAKYYS